jgi:glutathione S-transferase
MPDLKLISFDLCPYVQRAAIALAEKGVPFERITIDLANKPDWFLKVSPLGKVPVLLVDGELIFESAVIVEYLEETQPKPLHPADPLRRAQHRAWMEFASALLGDLWVLETTADGEVFEARRRGIADKLGRVEEALGAGPYFEGASFSLVDAVFAPVFRYFDTLDRHADLGVFDGLPKVRAWRDAVHERPSVRDAVVGDYGARLEAFLLRQGGVFAGRMKQAA